MGYKSKLMDPPLYYEEKTTSERSRRYCLKPVKLIETKAAKAEECVNIQFNRGNKTNINVDNVEEKKIQEHFDFVTTKLQKLHKSVMWNMFIGRSFLEKIEPDNRAQEEVNIDNSVNSEFDINNVKTWSKDCISHIENTLKVNEIQNDGLVCLFSVANDDSERDIDSDEVAWEIEKVAVYHCVNTYSQRLLNQEGCMARQGMDPISRKVRTPGRNRSGYVVYLAYQLVDSITFGQVMVETVLYGVDIEMKKKQILHQLGDLKMSPPVDDRIRKVVKDVKEFMGKEQVEILHLLKDVKDKEKLSIVAQFIQLLQAGGQHQGGMAGLNQFVTFLSQKDSMKRSSSRQSLAGESTSGSIRPSLSRSNSARSRKQSSTSSFSSCSTTPEIPRCNSAGSQNSPRSTPVRKTSTVKGRRQSNLAAIQSDEESMSSSSETLMKTNNHKTNGHSSPGKQSGITDRPDRPRRTMSVQAIGGRPAVNGNMKKVRALSVTERPGVMREEGKKVEDSVKVSEIVKGKVQQRTSSSSPKLGQKKSVKK